MLIARCTILLLAALLCHHLIADLSHAENAPLLRLGTDIHRSADTIRDCLSHESGFTVIGWDGVLQKLELDGNTETFLESAVLPMPRGQIAATTRDGTTVAVVCNDKKIRVGNFENHTIIIAGVLPDDTTPVAVSFDDRNRLMAAILKDNKTQIGKQDHQRVLEVIETSRSKTVCAIPLKHDPANVFLSSHARLLIVVHSKDFLTVWDVETGKKRIEVRMQSIQEPSIFLGESEFAVFETKPFRLTRSAQKEFRIVDLRSGKRVHKILGSSSDRCIGASPNGDLFALLNASATRSLIRVVQVATGNDVLKKEIPEIVAGPARFSGDRRFMLLADTATRKLHRARLHSINIWRLEDGALVSSQGGHAGPVRCVRFLDGEEKIVSTSSDGTVRVWDAKKGTEISVVLSNATGSAIAISNDGHWIATPIRTDGQQNLAILNAKTYEVMSTLPLARPTECTSLSFAANGEAVVVGSCFIRGIWNNEGPSEIPANSTLQVWDLDYKGRFPKLLAKQNDKGRFRGHSNALWSCKCFHTTSKFATGGNWTENRSEPGQGAVTIWNLIDGSIDRVIGPIESPVVAIAISNDDSLIAAASSRVVSAWGTSCVNVGRQLYGQRASDRVINIWNANDGRPIAKLRGSESDVTSLEFSPDGRFLASVSLDGFVRIWDPRSAKLVRTLSGHRGGLLCVTFAPKRPILATGGQDTTITLWDLADLIRD